MLSKLAPFAGLIVIVLLAIHRHYAGRKQHVMLIIGLLIGAVASYVIFDITHQAP